MGAWCAMRDIHAGDGGGGGNANSIASGAAVPGASALDACAWGVADWLAIGPCAGNVDGTPVTSEREEGRPAVGPCAGTVGEALARPKRGHLLSAIDEFKIIRLVPCAGCVGEVASCPERSEHGSKSGPDVPRYSGMA